MRERFAIGRYCQRCGLVIGYEAARNGMDDGSSVNDRYRALIEKMILDAGMELPGVYDGLRGKEFEEHENRVARIRREKWELYRGVKRV